MIDTNQTEPAAAKVVDEAAPTYLHFDGMAWPDPADPREVEWTLRYGTPTREQVLVAASFIAAYKQLVADPQRARNDNVRRLRAACTPPQDRLT